jgi:hypothetical protein
MVESRWSHSFIFKDFEGFVLVRCFALVIRLIVLMKSKHLMIQLQLSLYNPYDMITQRTHQQIKNSSFCVYSYGATYLIANRVPSLFPIRRKVDLQIMHS